MKNGNGARRAEDTTPGGERPLILSAINELKAALEDHVKWTRKRDEHTSETLSGISARVAHIEGRLESRINGKS